MEIVAALTFCPAVTHEQQRRRTITTMLLTTGVHIGAAKWPRALRIAPASEVIP